MTNKKASMTIQALQFELGQKKKAALRCAEDLLNETKDYVKRLRVGIPSNPPSHITQTRCLVYHTELRQLESALRIAEDCEKNP